VIRVVEDDAPLAAPVFRLLPTLTIAWAQVGRSRQVDGPIIRP